MNDVLTSRDVNEIADSPAGVTQEAIAVPLQIKTEGDAVSSSSSSSTAPPPGTQSSSQVGRICVATIRRDGKVDIKEAKDFTEFR